MMSSGAQSPTTGYLTMRLASEYYALPGTSVREIMRWRTPTPVPGAPPMIPGLINQRGQILTVIDARLLLGLAAAPLDRSTRLVWIQHHATDAALLVDAVIDLITIAPDHLTPPPINLTGSAQRVIQAVYQRDDDQPTAILDPSALLILVQEAL